MYLVAKVIRVACHIAITASIVGALAGFVSSDAFAQSAPKLDIRTLSSRPDMVSGGDALVEVKMPAGISFPQIKLTLNGKDVTNQLKSNADTGSLRGVISGM